MSDRLRSLWSSNMYEQQLLLVRVADQMMQAAYTCRSTRRFDESLLEVAVALEYVQAAVAQKVAHGKAGERGVSYAVVREGGGKRLLRVAVRDEERRLVGLIPTLRLVERLSTTISLPS